MHYTSVIFNLVHIHKAQAMCEVIESSLKMESNCKFLIVFSIFCLIFLFNIIEFRFRFELLNPKSNHPDYIMLEQVNIIQQNCDDLISIIPLLPFIRYDILELLKT